MARLLRSTFFLVTVVLMTTPVVAQTADLHFEVPAIGDRRLRIEQAQVVAEPDIQRFEALGVVASIQPS
jgi:predicted amidohydrolase YtcJ